jgi:hypothetical protein
MARKMDLREAKDDEGRNALDAAATEGQLEVCRFLVEESGFDVKCTSTNGERRLGLGLAEESIMRVD